MLQFSMFMTMMLSLTFMQMNHPLSMLLIIITQTLMICIITGILSPSFWFSYILFLIFLGGMLVLFIYITSLASNEMLPIPIKSIIMSFVLISTSILLSTSIDSTLWTSYIMNSDSTMFQTIQFHPESSIPLIKLYNSPTKFITLLLVMYLLLTLIAIVKITNIFQGPLRQKN